MEGSNVEQTAKRKKYLHLLSLATKSNVAFANNATAKRVIAPYVNLQRRGQKITMRRGRDTFNFFQSKKANYLIKNLSAHISGPNDFPHLLYDTAQIIKTLINSLGVRVYMMDLELNQLYQFQLNAPYRKCRVNYDLQTTKNIATHVANTKEYLMLDDINNDSRFPDGVDYKDNIKSVLCVPILSGENCYSVMEFYREMDQKPFDKSNMKLVVLVAGWIGLSIQQNHDRVLLHKQQEINDDLLQFVLAYYRNSVSFENVLGEILNYTKKQLNAEKGAFYIITRDKEKDLVADVYEEGITVGDQILIRKKLAIRMGKEKTVAGWVAQNCELMNMKDVYADPRFTKDVSKDNEHLIIIRTELCMPIMGLDGIIGIITIINKANGKFFTSQDESLIKIVATYSSMALHYQKALRDNEKANLQINQATDLLQFHLIPCTHSIQELENEDFQVPKNIKDFAWYTMQDDLYMMPKYCVWMIRDLLGDEIINRDQLNMFVMAVHKAYRANPYHNFEHGFNVFHCIYTILLRNRDKFSLLDCQSLVVAALTHDIDHQAVTNSYLIITGHTLSKLYSDAPWENHHCFVAKQILSVFNIFNNLDEEAYKVFIEQIEYAILSTDLMWYFKVRAKLQPILKESLFDVNNPEHKKMLISTVMTVCDLSGSSKPFSVSKNIADNLYREFYNQGDIEKSLGLLPLSMMDRYKQINVPEDQMNFLSIIVMPAMILLMEILPNVDMLYYNTELVRDTWKKIIESRGDKLWRQCDSILP